MVMRQLPNLEATNQERQEWQSFLALHALLDVSAVDALLYRRCLSALWLLRGRDLITRADLVRATGLEFHKSPDLLIAQLIREQVLAPVPSRPFSFRIKAQGWTNPESAYAGDDRQSLITVTREEQAQRFRILRELRDKIEAADLSARRRERMQKELEELRKIYDATWLELSDAIGAGACESIQNEIETGNTTRTTQFDLCFEE
jgi:hypothetical protein